MIDGFPSTDSHRPNPDWAKLPLFNRKGWKRMPFGTFANSINERVEPINSAEEIYVGLEHLDSQNLHVRRWGKGSDVIGTKLRFRKGDIIFGRRRAYQRKLAVAEFDGICSAHAMVVRAKPELVLPEFLPFLMMSDKFMTRAVDISVGSLSPTINWKTLKLEEFNLPPLDQQRRIAEILWAVDDALQSWLICDVHTRITQETFAAQLFDISMANQPKRASAPTSATLRDSSVLVIDGDRGKQYPKEAEYSPNGHCLFLSAANVTKGGFVFQSNKFISTERDALLGKGKLKRGDIIVTTRGTVGNIAFYHDKVPFDHVRINSGMVILRNNSASLLTEYLYKFLTSPIIDRQLQKLSFGSAQKQLTVRLIENLHIPIRSLEEQMTILRTLGEIEASKDPVMRHCEMLQNLSGAISEHLFVRT